jgi:hypothetical protein
MDNAHRLLSSPAAKAFDLSLEPKESVMKYVPADFDPANLNARQGRDGSYESKTIGRFGLGCLLARRLAEVGARYIEVTTEYIPFLNWDTHENGHSRAAAMKAMVDAPVSQLILDLEARGLLKRTLIVLASEFSRDALIEGKPNKLVRDQVRVPDKIEDPSSTACTATSPTPAACFCSAAASSRATSTARPPTSAPAKPSETVS